MNLKDILIKKAEYPVRLIAKQRNFFKQSDDSEFVLHELGDEVGIELIDFSACWVRVCNKSEVNPVIFEICYDRDTWELKGEWDFKPKK